jgi:coniferyl-aldehyde dehydrogenase
MTSEDETSLPGILQRQRDAFLRDGPPSRRERRRDLKKLKAAILAREDDFAAALDQDFGHRSKEESLLLDVASTVASINYLHRNLARFMRPGHRDVAMIFRPGRNRVIYQPRGVVGIVSPWNYPVGLALIRKSVAPSRLSRSTTCCLRALSRSGAPSCARQATISFPSRSSSAASRR